MKELDSDIEKVSEHLTKKQSDFDKVMQLSRELIREAGQAITLMHNDEKKKALDKLYAMAGTVNKLRKTDAMFKDNTLQAYQEYAEAFIFINIKTKRKIPNMKSVGVDEEAYLLGLMDVEGELKREILEALRANKMKDAEWYFDTMKGIYDSTRRLKVCRGGPERVQEEAGCRKNPNRERGQRDTDVQEQTIKMKVLFICRGNAGRSQTAEAFFKHYTKKHKASSAGINVYVEKTAGMPPRKEIADLLKKNYGIDISKNKRKQVTQKRLEDADRIVVLLSKNEYESYVPKYFKKFNSKISHWSNFRNKRPKSHPGMEANTEGIRKLVKNLAKEIG